MPEYIPAKTANEFHQDNNFVRLLIGPIGSGKSVSCLMELIGRAYAQEPGPDGVRRSRWAVIRNSYRELQDTTINTFFDWVPKDLGLFKVQDMKFILEGPMGDGTNLHLEVMFRALDKPNDVKKLLSLELTGAFINEAREVPKQILDMLMGRVGRYPSKRQGGPSWFGIILDTNPPDTDHWMYTLFEEIRPENHSVYHQPSGLSENAENIPNLPPNYYTNMMAGKDKEWINVYVHGKYGFVTEGMPVFPEYKDDVHFVPHPIAIPKDTTLYIGIDFGLTPAATIGFELNGQLAIVDEVVTRDMGAVRFGQFLGKHLRKNYRGHTLIITGDPAGEQRAQTDERTPFEILGAVGIEAEPAHTNDFSIR